MFVSDSQILSDVAAALKQPDANAWIAKSGWVTTAVQLPHLQAYNDIVSGLSARGYSPAQIAAWDRGAEFERVFGTYWFLVENSLLSQVAKDMIEKYERYEKKLHAVAVTNGGAFVNPLGPQGQAVSGSYDTSQDEFVYEPQRCDPRAGYEAQF